MALSQISGTTGIEDATITSIKLADFAAAVDLNGVELILDADQDTSISADTDDQIDIKIAGADDFQFTANTFTALAGSGVVIPDGGLTLGSTAVTSTAAELNLLDGVSGLVQADLTKLAAVDATAVEINLIDGGTARGTDALASGDGILINDAGTMKMTNVDTVLTFMQSGIVGKQTIWIPAAAITPTASNGCATRTQVETTAGRPDMDVLDFDASADEHAQFSVAFPKSWNLGTVTFQVFWTSTATDTDGVAWGLQGVACSNDGTIDVAYGTAVVVTDDNISAAEDCLVTAESGAVTIAGTPADDDLCFFRIFRDVSDANDDMAEDARLIGIKLFFTTDALNDD